MTWPDTPDDPRERVALAAPVDASLVPGEAWFTQEAADALRADIDALLDGRGGSYSVVVAGADGYILYERDNEARYEAASFYKLAVLVEVFRQRQSGALSLDDVVLIEPVHLTESPGEIRQLGHEFSIDILLRQMITWSSNVAGWALLDLVGTGHVNRTLAGLGLSSTFIEQRPFASVVGHEPEIGDQPHLTSAADLARLFQLLLDGRVVSPEASAEMLDLLSQQSISNRLPAYLPWDAVVAHKTGNLSGMVHDAGVIFTPNGPVIVAVLTSGVYEWEAIDVIARIGALVYHFGAPVAGPGN
ncbi:MAG TPA: serine hydrolase [Thermomicrobiales bacterium]|nr:serine hydrolase [Thermomicrobiales bacterium]